MLRHTGQKRSFQHNLWLAILLCLNAGFVNAAGFIAFAVLTTNVTGHAALLAVNITTGKYKAAWLVALWLLVFLAGAFTSSAYIRKAGRDKRNVYTVPILVMIAAICVVIFLGRYYDRSLLSTEYFAGSLLFAMGMQNAMVTIVSGSVVRTTHLTGMFTDLGIDLAAAVFHFGKQDRALRRRILLRLSIIVFFLVGGVLGGWLFLQFSYRAFFVPVLLLLTALLYDFFRLQWTLFRRQYRSLEENRSNG